MILGAQIKSKWTLFPKCQTSLCEDKKHTMITILLLLFTNSKNALQNVQGVYVYVYKCINNFILFYFMLPYFNTR